jgi:DNA-binding NtrC family response regulator
MIDDELPILDAFQTILEDFGYSVTVCPDAIEGEQLALAHRYDLILIDLRMPEKNGAEVTKSIHNKHPDSKILIITGYPNDPLAKRALDYGALSLLKKPFEIGKILDFLRETEDR